MVDDVDCSLYTDGVRADMGVVPPFKVVTHTKINHLKKKQHEQEYDNIEMTLSALNSPTNHLGLSGRPGYYCLG